MNIDSVRYRKQIHSLYSANLGSIWLAATANADISIGN